MRIPKRRRAMGGNTIAKCRNAMRHQKNLLPNPPKDQDRYLSSINKDRDAMTNLQRVVSPLTPL
jgi:hypothetical protein